MSVAALLLAAGPGAVPAGRPRSDVAHAAVGATTPSGRHLRDPRSTLCHAYVRRLTVLEREGSPRTSTVGRRACTRCLNVIAAQQRRRTTTTPTYVHRDALVEAHRAAGTTAYGLALAAQTAETLDEVEQLEHLALVVVGFPACRRADVVTPDGEHQPPLDKQLARARVRLGAGRPDPLANVPRDNGAYRRDWIALWRAQREAEDLTRRTGIQHYA